MQLPVNGMVSLWKIAMDTFWICNEVSDLEMQQVIKVEALAGWQRLFKIEAIVQFQFKNRIFGALSMLGSVKIILYELLVPNAISVQKVLEYFPPL